MRVLLFLIFAMWLVGCGGSKSSFSPATKYSPRQLQKDYAVYQAVLEEAHPSLYWYASKDSMDHFFKWGASQLNDSLTEPEFRKVLNYVTSKINCGHTSVRASKKFAKYNDTAAIRRIFPLSVKAWSNTHKPGEDTIVVTANLNRKDSILRRGTIITGINGRPVSKIIDTLFDYISTDGYNRTHKFQTLSNRGFFGSLYTSLFGFSSRYTIDYIDSTGEKKRTSIPLYFPSLDTATRAAIRPVTRVPQPSRKERKQRQLNSVRLLRIDTVNRTAFMDLATFGRGYGLKGFFKRSFRVLKERNIEHLIIDVRSNGGGNVTNSTLITRYLADHPFKVGDSLYAVTKRKSYGRYIQNDFFNRLFMTFFTRKKKDGNYHFGYYEKHFFKPRKKHHFGNKVYILTGGNSFSATTLFVGQVIGQQNVSVIGEETGGGSYGNSAWLIPDVKLPETGVRFRLPLFRLVVDKTAPKTGRGLQPEIPSLPTVEAIRRGADFKAEKAMELIIAEQQKAKNDATINR